MSNCISLGLLRNLRLEVCVSEFELKGGLNRRFLSHCGTNAEWEAQSGSVGSR